MPYIEQELRADAASHPLNAGQLNFAITTLVNRYLDRTARGPLTYGKVNEVIGVLECAKLELYRRVAAPYEDKKKRANGDVY